MFKFLALEETTTAAPTGGMPAWTTYIFYGVLIVGIILVFWFMSRKQKKQDKEINDMRNGLRVGDEVTTIGGIVGRIVQVKEETVVIETSRDGTKIRFLKSAISKVDVPVGGTVEKSEPKADEAKKEEPKKEEPLAEPKKKRSKKGE